MKANEHRTLSRDLEVVAIPYGERLTLPAGSLVLITQSLGGNYTVLTDQGYMVRIEAKDADAIGEEPKIPSPNSGGSAAATPHAGPAEESAVWDQLKTVFDPEIPVNIVDLGLVYKCELTPAADGGTDVEIEMTMTAPGCGMGEYLKEDVRQKVHSVPGVREVRVEVVWEPPWDPSRMSEVARLELGMM